MLFNALALFLPLILAAPSPAPYNPFPSPDAPNVFYGRSAFTPELLAAYKTPEMSGTTPVQSVMEAGKHFKRGVAVLELRGVGQGRRSKVRVVKRQAATCRPIASVSASSISATITSMPSSTSTGSKTVFKDITPPAWLTTVNATSTAVVVPSDGPINPSASVSSVVPANPTNSPSPWAPGSISSSASSLASSSASSQASSSASSQASSTSSPSSSTPSSSSTSSSSTSSSTAAPTAAPIPAPSPSPSSSSISPSPIPSPSPSPSAAPVARLTVDPSGTDGPFSGWGTWYDVGLGACGKWDTPDQPIVALSAELMNSWPGYNGANPNNFPMCGKHIKINWRGKSAIARVADQCPGCAVRSLDMSKGLFEQFATLDVGLLGMDSYTGNITWSWVQGEGALPSLPYTP